MTLKFAKKLLSSYYTIWSFIYLDSIIKEWDSKRYIGNSKGQITLRFAKDLLLGANEDDCSNSREILEYWTQKGYIHYKPYKRIIKGILNDLS